MYLSIYLSMRVDFIDWSEKMRHDGDTAPRESPVAVEKLRPPGGSRRGRL